MSMPPAWLFDLSDKLDAPVVPVNTKHASLAVRLGSALVLQVHLVRHVAKICDAVVGVVTILVVDLVSWVDAIDV